MKIAYRSSINKEEFNNLVPIRVGMCITTRVLDNFSPQLNSPLPFNDFVYIITHFNEETVFLVDTSHNNTCSISKEDLSSCELVTEFHRNNLCIDCDHVNRVLTDMYSK